MRNSIQSAHEVQREKVQFHSLFGIWFDVAKTIEFKISPSVGGAKIKVWAVKDFSAIEKISVFCGLDVRPKRTNWQGFDLITNLEKKGDSFVNGVVHMPNNKRKNLADFRIVDPSLAELNFFYRDSSQETKQNSGFILLTQKKTHQPEAKEGSLNIP